MKKKIRQKDRVDDAATPTARWRSQLGLSQEEAGTLLDVSKRTIQLWEDPGTPAAPCKSHRIVMAMHVLGIPCPVPIPEK